VTARSTSGKGPLVSPGRVIGVQRCWTSPLYASNRPLGAATLTQRVAHGCVVFAVEGHQLVEDVVSSLQAGMAKDLLTGHHLEGDAAETAADADAAMAGGFAGGPPVVGQAAAMVVAADQVVGDAHNGGAQLVVAAAHQGAVGMIYFVALITRRSQAGAAGDGAGVGVVADRSGLAGEVGVLSSLCRRLRNLLPSHDTSSPRIPSSRDQPSPALRPTMATVSCTLRRL